MTAEAPPHQTSAVSARHEGAGPVFGCAPGMTETVKLAIPGMEQRRRSYLAALFCSGHL
jgi:hypothetical protein